MSRDTSSFMTDNQTLKKQEVINIFIFHKLNIISKYIRPKFDKLCFDDRKNSFNATVQATLLIKKQDMNAFKNFCLQISDEYVNSIDCSKRQKEILQHEMLFDFMIYFNEIQKLDLAIGRLNSPSECVANFALKKSMKKALALKNLSNEKNYFKNLNLTDNSLAKLKNKKLKRVVNAFNEMLDNSIYDFSPIETEKKVRKELNKILKILDKYNTNEVSYSL